MTSFVLGLFKGVLYLQLLASTLLGYLIGATAAAPWIAQYGGPGYMHLAGAIGAFAGFITGTLFVGYGLALLSINSHLANLAAANEGTVWSVPRVEPQMSSQPTAAAQGRP